MPLLTRAMPLFETRAMPLQAPERQPLTSMWLGLEPITHTLLIQNMAGDKCTQEAEPGLDGTGPGGTGHDHVESYLFQASAHGHVNRKKP